MSSLSAFWMLEAEWFFLTPFGALKATASQLTRSSPWRQGCDLRLDYGEP